MGLTPIERFARWVARRDEIASTMCHWCKSNPIAIRPARSYGYCSVECVEADAMDQAERF